MEKIGDIEIRVVGKSGNQSLSPDNYDIKHIATILQNIEDLLYPNNKKDRPIITYDIQEGSVRHLFKTTIQTVIGFSAVLGQVQANESIDFLKNIHKHCHEGTTVLTTAADYVFHEEHEKHIHCLVMPRAEWVKIIESEGFEMINDFPLERNKGMLSYEWLPPHGRLAVSHQLNFKLRGHK